MEHLRKYWWFYLLIIIAIIVYINRDKLFAKASSSGVTYKIKEGGVASRETTFFGLSGTATYTGKQGELDCYCHGASCRKLCGKVGDVYADFGSCPCPGTIK